MRFNKIFIVMLMIGVLAGFSLVVNAIEAGEWQIIDDDLVIVGTGDNNYLMWPRCDGAGCLGTAEGGTKQWKTLKTDGQPIWNYTTNSYIYPSGESVADYPAFAWVEGLDWKGYTDWRLPGYSDLGDLRSFGMDYIAYTPGYYWVFQTDNSWYSYCRQFPGNDDRRTKTEYNHVRAVRSGVLDTSPTYANFTSSETTNFSAVNDITNITSLTLAKTGKGKIKFPESTEINAEAQDYDTNIVIEDEFISVNTAALDESFNTSATISLEGVTCPVETITYQEGTFTTKDDIIAGGKNCELDGVCSNILCSDSTLTFDVAHFTGFAAGSDANLTTEAQAGVFYPFDPIEFTAEYINSTDGTLISGECNITFDDDWDTEYTMDFDSIDYNYTKSFATSGLHEYNVTCSSANFVTLEANDTKLVSSVDIPEFSVLTLGLGLIAVLVGLFIIRRKK